MPEGMRFARRIISSPSEANSMCNIRIAAVADLHCSEASQGVFQPLLAQASSAADILVLAGDLTDHGLPEEARVLIAEMSEVRIPVIAVLGNHDYHNNAQAEIAHMLTAAGTRVLDGDDCELLGIGFAGVKGFGGGFGRQMLEAWGEEGIKDFVHESVAEALKLERALARLHTPQRVAVLHYAPIEATVAGEPPPLYPFLGSGRLEEPLCRYGVVAVVHGHAHHGSPEGRLASGAPVYNVSLPVLRSRVPASAPFRVFTVTTESADSIDAPMEAWPDR
jgi:Icc-related predicted phosphoesterase